MGIKFIKMSPENTTFAAIYDTNNTKANYLNYKRL